MKLCWKSFWLIGGICLWLCPPVFTQQETVTLEVLSNKIAEINKKIDQVTQNQQQILSKLAEIQDELGVVKVRATRH